MTAAPEFTLTAVRSGRTVSTVLPMTVPLLLVFHGRAGTNTATAINVAVRGDYPEATTLQIASIVDLSHIPTPFQGAARMALEIAYQHAARQLPAGLDPSDYVLIVADWDGRVTRAYQMTYRVDDIGLAVVNQQGQFAGSYTGREPVQAALRLARQLVLTSAL